jgi:hypothetical protein
MNHIGFLEEAQNCRRRALTYVGQPEAALLLRVAKEFEELDAQKRSVRPTRDRTAYLEAHAPYGR